MTPTPQRSGALDLIRIVGVAAIVAGHVWTQRVTGLWFYAWHVPIFFILSGYLWRPGRSLSTEIRNRGRSLGRPYVMWFVLITGVLLAMSIVNAEPVVDRILGGLTGGRFARLPYATLWFVSALFFTAILFRAVERLPYWAQWVIAVAGAAASWIWGQALSFTPLGMGYAITCLIYLLIGDGLRRARTHITMPALTGGLLIAGGMFVVLAGWVPPVDIKLGNYGMPVLSLFASTAISIGFILVAEAAVKPGKFSNLCTYLALPLLAVVLAHPVFLWLPQPLWLKFALALVIPAAVGLIALQSPISQWVTGQQRRIVPVQSQLDGTISAADSGRDAPGST